MSKNFLNSYDIIDYNRDTKTFTVKDKESDNEIQFTFDKTIRNNNVGIALELYDSLFPNVVINDNDGDKEKAYIIRQHRNDLLQQTDKFVSIPDYPITTQDRELIIEFRQQLRDITLQAEFPQSITWPSIPDCISDSVSVIESQDYIEDPLTV